MATARIISVSKCDDFLAVRLGKPQGFQFRAGQWLRLTVGTAEGPDTRTLSIASAPGDEWLEVGTRLSGSAFKRSLEALKVEDAVEIQGPGGRLTLPEPMSSVVLLVGGIGITPIRSLLRERVQRGERLDGAVMVYGNRTEKCVPYDDELASWEDAGLRLVRVLEVPPDGWQGESGFITADILRRAGVDDVKDIVITGPPVMVEAMVRVLDEVGVPSEKRRIESFGTVPASAVG